MRLHEYEGADIFESMKIPVPRRDVAESVEDASRIAGEIGYPVILKAQVLVGGRGLAGGIKIAETPEDLEYLAGELFGKEIKGLHSVFTLIMREIFSGSWAFPSAPSLLVPM